MKESLIEALKRGEEVMPPLYHYAELMLYLHDKTGMDYESIHEKYGHATYKQWAEALKD